MNLKEDMKARRDKFWNKEMHRIKKLINDSMLTYQQQEYFGSKDYSITLIVLQGENDTSGGIDIFVDICDCNCEGDIKNFYLAYCKKDVAVVEYVNKIAAILTAMGFEITKCISEFSREDIDKCNIILQALMQLN